MLPEGETLGLASTVASDSTGATASQELGSMASMLTALARTESVALAPGTLVADQYRIERAIGEGGMGVVFLARDVHLDRAVAVKVCTGLSASAVHRIQREAIALAKLAHPNVVVLFQAGELKGRFFIAMEHVAGGTARTWLAQASRTPREIIALYVDAGTGLAAAHAEGLVHRDFKPDNVLVGTDGRARVADFGLVRTSGDDAPIATATPEPRSGDLATEGGTILGTPGYMPPEQLVGAEIDGRADQYAFAASLWEALAGWRPAVGGSHPDRAVESGDRLSEVPRHVVVALRRALAENRDDRWPDMTTLLSELRRDPGARRRRLALGFGVLGLAPLATALALALQPDASPRCDDGAERIAIVWGPGRRASLATLVDANAWPAIEQRMQARTQAWVKTYEEACRATHVDGAVSEALLYRRMLCLEARRDELDVTLSALQSGSRTAIASAAEAIDLLPVSEHCLQPDSAGASQEPPPSDPERRVQIAKAQRAAAEANAAALDPAILDARGNADRAVSMARATHWSPIVAEALVARGNIFYTLGRHEEAIADYEEAIALALAAGSDTTAVRALSSSAWALTDRARFGEAKLALTTANAMWTRAGEPAHVGHVILGAEAHLALAEERPQEALAATRAQIVAIEQAHGPSTLSAASNAYNLAIALDQAGEKREAAQAAARAVELAREALGDDHPTVASRLALAAQIAIEQGRVEEGIDLATRSLTTFEQWFGPDDVRLAAPISSLFSAAHRQGRLDDAHALALRELEIRRKHRPDDPHLFELEANLAVVACERGDYERAAKPAARALAGLERLHGPNHPALINALLLAGYIARERPDPDLAASARDLARAFAIGELVHGPDHAETINAEIELAITEIANGETARAAERMQRRLAHVDGLDLPLHMPHELRATLARALVASGAIERGCALARDAEDGLRKIEFSTETVARWRTRHCGAE